MEGAEVIARSIPRFAIFEDLYLHRINLATKLIKSLEEALIRLYGAIFQYLAKAKKYFEQSTASTSYFYSSISAGLKCLNRTRLGSLGKPSRGIPGNHTRGRF